MTAARWAHIGQPLAPLDDLPPAMADAVLMVKGEWSAIEAEMIDAASKGHRT